jgi:hypothetical protein
MAKVEATVDEIDIGHLDLVECWAGPAWMRGTPRLLLQGSDGTTVLAKAAPEQIELLELVWLATTRVTESETLADLRAVHAARQARLAATTKE